MKDFYDITDWYWIIGGDTTRAYSSKLRDYISITAPVFTSWSADGSEVGRTDSEASMGAALASYPTLRPIPPGILDGYLDARVAMIVQEPDFRLWIDMYTEVVHPTPTETQVRARIRSKL